MKKFHITLKTKRFNKNFIIDSQDEATAKLWADKQLAVFKTSGKVTVTPYLVGAKK